MANKENEEKVSEELTLKEKDDCLEENIEERSDSSVSGTSTLDDSFEQVEFPNISPDHKVIKQIGKGGMGRVFEVKDLKLDKVVAIKVLQAKLATDKAALKRFEQEAEAAANLHHPNLGTTYSHGTTQDGEPYIVLDYYEGESLADIIEKEGVLSAKRALALLIQICEGLNYAHSKGVIHRDLKPTNIIVSPCPEGGEIARIVDFGIAKVMPKENRETHNLTETGEVFGSPNYMSPEQCLGFMLDNRSDIYSLGCLMYEMLTGDPPYGGSNPIQVVVKHINEEIKPFAEKIGFDKTNKNLEGVVLRCLEKDQVNRYQSIDALLKDLELVSEGKQPSKYKRKVKQKREFTKRQLVGTIVGIAALVFYGGVSAAFFHQYYMISIILFGLLIFLVTGGIYVGFGSFFDQMQKIDKFKHTGTGWWLSSLSLSFGFICLTILPYALGGAFCYYFYKQFHLENIVWPVWLVSGCYYDFFFHLIAVFLALVSGIGIVIFRSKKSRGIGTFLAQFMAIVLSVVISSTMMFPERISQTCSFFASATSIAMPEVSRLLANTAYELYKKDSTNAFVMAEVEILNGNYDRAFSVLNDTKYASQSEMETIALKVLAYRMQGDYSEALRELSKSKLVVGSWGSRAAQNYNLKGEIYEDMKDFKTALKWYSKAVEANSQERLFGMNKIRMLCALNNYPEALKYTKQYNLNKKDHKLNFLQAMIQEKLGDLKGAKKSYRDAAGFIYEWYHPSYNRRVKLKNRQFGLLANLMNAYCHIKIGQDKKAIAKFNAALPMTKQDLSGSSILKNTGLSPDWSRLE